MTIKELYSIAMWYINKTKWIDKLPEVMFDWIDYSNPYWRGDFFRMMETDFNPYNAIPIQYEGRKLSEVIKEVCKWKTGDLKNGWKSISISEFPITESDLHIICNKSWEGLKIYKKGGLVGILKQK